MTSSIPLNRLLSRLEHNLLSSTPDPRLQHSQYERNRVGANIEHARAMLLTLEKQTASVRQKQQVQTDLQAKKDLIKKLNARLRELNDRAVDVEEDEDENEDEIQDDDVLNAYAPARKDTEAGLETGGSRSGEEIHQQQELRSRRQPLAASDNRSSATTSAREQLFAERSKKEDPNLQQTEALMSHNRTEQETLTQGLLGLAQALKQSTMSFSSSLEAEKEVRARAEAGLDKSAQGMETAEKKMSMLRKMSEGQGWYGRIKLYGFIAGLWLACFLLVFVGPKLRF